MGCTLVYGSHFDSLSFPFFLLLILFLQLIFLFLLLLLLLFRLLLFLLLFSPSDALPPPAPLPSLFLRLSFLPPFPLRPSLPPPTLRASIPQRQCCISPCFRCSVPPFAKKLYVFIRQNL